MVDGADPVRQLLPERGLVEEVGTRMELTVELAVDGRMGHDFARELDATHEQRHIGLCLEEAGVDERRREWVGAGQPDGATALGVDEGGQQREGGPLVHGGPHGRILVGRRVGPGQAVELQVGDRRAAIGLHEGERLKDRPVEPGGLAGHRLEDAGEEVPGRAHMATARGEEGHGEEEVVMQVLAHGQVGAAGDALLCEVLGGADAREQQNLRRADDAGREDDLA